MLGEAMLCPPTSYRMLVVDDEDDAIDLVAFNLRAVGIEVVVARNGLEAVERSREQRPDLVILDLMLPELDGISACELIRQQPETAETPIIMLTAWATNRARTVGFQAGASDYITKPVSPRELVRRVQALLPGYPTRQEPALQPEMNELSVNFKERQVSVDGREVLLSAAEFRLLALLLQAVFQRLEPHCNSQARS